MVVRPGGASPSKPSPHRTPSAVQSSGGGRQIQFGSGKLFLIQIEISKCYQIWRKTSHPAMGSFLAKQIARSMQKPVQYYESQDQASQMSGDVSIP